MADASPNSDDSSLVKKTLDWIAEAGINGLGVLPSAKKVADDHLRNTGDPESAIDSIIFWRTTYAAGTGFVSGVGGIAVMPVAIPAALLASYALAANTAAAIACLRGYDIYSEQARTMILLCLLGENAEQFLKNAGIAIGNKLAKNLIQQIPGKVLIDINKRIGFRLITKGGAKGVINLARMVPLAGGVVGAGFDSFFVKACGSVSKKVFVI